MSQDREIAALGGGCFWCSAAVLEQLRAVERVVSIYAGARTEPYVPPRLRKGHQPRGGRAGHARPAGDLVPRVAGGVLHHSRPDHTEPPGRGCRTAVPLHQSSTIRPNRKVRGWNDRGRSRGPAPAGARASSISSGSPAATACRKGRVRERRLAEARPWLRPPDAAASGLLRRSWCPTPGERPGHGKQAAGIRAGIVLFTGLSLSQECPSGQKVSASSETITVTTMEIRSNFICRLPSGSTW